MPIYDNVNEDISEQSHLLTRRGILKNSYSREPPRSSELEIASGSKRSRILSIEEFMTTHPTSFSLNDISTTNNEHFGRKYCSSHKMYESIACGGRILSDSHVLYQDRREQHLEPNVTVHNPNNKHIPAYQPPFDEFKIKVMDKDSIVKMWLESDYRLRRELQKTADEKKALESKLVDLQRLIRKPP